MKEIAEQTVSVRRLGEKNTKVEQLNEIVKQLTEEAKSPDQLAFN
jgi:threonyl-tRNA synthetase